MKARSSIWIIWFDDFNYLCWQVHYNATISYYNENKEMIPYQNIHEIRDRVSKKLSQKGSENDMGHPL